MAFVTLAIQHQVSYNTLSSCHAVVERKLMWSTINSVGHSKSDLRVLICKHMLHTKTQAYTIPLSVGVFLT